jgi:hypothetical protein
MSSSANATASTVPYYTGNVQLMEARFLELSSSIRALFQSNQELEVALLAAPEDKDFSEAIVENKALIVKQRKELTQVVQSMRNLGSNIEVPVDIQIMQLNSK